MEAVVKEHVEGGDKARRVNHISRTNSTHSTTSIGASAGRERRMSEP
jgi:hypothetical protein